MCTRGLASKNSATLAVLWAAKLSAMQCRSRWGGVWATRSPKKATKLSLLVEFVTHPAIVPSWTLRAANSTAGPWRLYSNSRLAGLPGMAGLVRVARDFACMPDFSSTDHTTAFCGGFKWLYATNWGERARIVVAG